MQCIVCNKEFQSKRSDAKCCSAGCRKKFSRSSVTANVTEKPLNVTENVTDKPNFVTDEVTDTTPTPQDIIKDLGLKPASEIFGVDTEPIDQHAYDMDFLPKCSVGDCYLRAPHGHDGYCIYHWRISEHMPHISPTSYKHLNIQAKRALEAITGTIIEKKG